MGNSLFGTQGQGTNSHDPSTNNTNLNNSYNSYNPSQSRTPGNISTPKGRTGEQSTHSSGSKNSSRGMSLMINPEGIADGIKKYDQFLTSVLNIYNI